MSFNLTQILTLLIIISFALSFLSLSMLTFLFVRMRQVLKQQEEIILLDKKINRRVTKKIESLAIEKIDGVITAIGSRLEEELKKHFTDLSEFAAEESNEMGKFIIKQQEAITRESQYHVANMLLKSEKEVAGYKQTKMKEVDQQVRDIVFRAAREVIGRSISFSEHEDLVNKALERAKKEKIFS
ncbi:hypothetical protein A3A54_02615 [Candidatus Curtissbacteria bacterium RIFCSPLOWO2_01_FULL_39_62]|uniref:ATP synthase F(0) sector subunit b n=2 Tax=Candidatus Curtissiibacteriota TaxID=1752717 RepID=A0A1F5GA16_9BACT|nr:MAG: hypothetical protein A2775_00200 [Candidatus Curtissbacteria bacterium RIFCSPHIGHO2_01_FULL_39_57]OGD88690.1 MAG: hypothetical protein A3D04_03695 [Candidatus Curtissbacteria bacterium RIFCSPHIGHO2_02_FULL_40_16b]OGE00420.1 MAG: hypothetical protein A3J17_01125 [Candidatus Curtissbacteria bacterium RIFCSPLOWO2_02_FULL_40_11]OGE01424.1 MAG: hypothetical protein A3A54_02615 [Candidatus Curtissbacteria bacterium RIFCSPLOWO2_01_FULL_39_62]OGE13465.1 MAG: hypothetical protein A3G14_03785 [Ca